MEDKKHEEQKPTESPEPKENVQSDSQVVKSGKSEGTKQEASREGGPSPELNSGEKTSKESVSLSPNGSAESPDTSNKNEKSVKEKIKYTQKPLFMEKPTACSKCGKTIKNRLWYSRDGHYYCNKRCWKAFADAKAAEIAKAAADAKAAEEEAKAAAKAKETTSETQAPKTEEKPAEEKQ